MIELENELRPTILKAISEIYSQNLNNEDIQFQLTRKDFEGDLTLVTFPFTKFSKKSPVDTGNEIGDYLVTNSELIETYNTVQGFLNLVISKSYWLKSLIEINQTDNYGQFASNGRSVMVEYSSPNTNKPLHLGHLRNNFLGYSVAQILKENGNDVIKTQIINDRGIHICKSMLAWERYGEGETPISSGLKGDKLVGKYYVKFDKVLKQETETLLEKWALGEFDVDEATIAEYQKLSKIKAEKPDEKSKKGIQDKINKLANNSTPIMLDVQQMLQDWEAKSPDVIALWNKMNGWVYEGFDATYKAMGVDFDKLYYESNTYLTGKELVVEGLEKGIFFEKPDGSVWIDLTDDGLDEKLVLRSDGTAVYMTQDIGTAQQRMKEFDNLTGIVYTVGNEQDYHFQVLFLILKKLGYKWADNCYHLSYGMVDLKNKDGQVGKMKSREGTVVDADDLIADVIGKAKEMTQERGQIEGLSEEDKDELYKMIGLAGLKYYLLKVDPTKRMTFNPEESVELNGNTGPFIQYAFARIQSLLRKGGELGPIDSKIDIHPIERDLIKKLIEYPSVIADAGSSYSPAIIASYAYDLAKLFNSFFQSISIFRESDLNVQNYRLVLSQKVGETIKTSMKMLGIDVPDRM
ncbi:arginine--tRNA ligase [Crocinitomix catalasitica]|uniref:arginine--tRNA ligase n=1 Tax=Crocinitomix catalasitica TaxID=184607 RepID=UPI000480DCAD|nr:arginine--tRNA ligase [Crocinitomix catalasitica]